MEASKGFNPQDFLANVRSEIGLGNKVNERQLRKTAQRYPQVFASLLDEVELHLTRADRTKIVEAMQLAHILGMDQLPKTGLFLNTVRKKYGIVPQTPLPQTQRRLDAKSKSLLTFGALGSLASLSPPYIPQEVKPPTVIEESKIVMPLATPAQTPRPTETPTATPTPEIVTERNNLLKEHILTKVYPQIEAMRIARAQKDPEYLKRINKELNERRINGVLLGGRNGEGEDQLSDTILVFSYDIASHSMHLYSVPRDLESWEVLRKTRDPRNSRFNQAYQRGGFPLIEQALENATGLSMDLKINAHFDVLVDLINQTAGTIEIDLDEDLEDNQYPTEDFGIRKIYYPKGHHVLNGEQALEVARSRMSTDDYERNSRQQKILEALLNKWFEELNSPLKAPFLLNKLESFWAQKIRQGTLKADFDLNLFSIPSFLDTIRKNPNLVWEQLRDKGLKLIQRPAVYKYGASHKNLIKEAQIPDMAINTLKDGNPNTSNPRDYYWPLRESTERFLTTNRGAEENVLEEIQLTIPPKHHRILYPQQLTNSEFQNWLPQLRGNHEHIFTQPISIKQLALHFPDERQRLLRELARSYAEGLIEHYGKVPALIGLDPGEGASATSSVSKSITLEEEYLREGELTWDFARMIADEIYRQTGGLYTVAILRDENPPKTLFPNEQPIRHEALLLEMDTILRPPQERGNNLVYLPFRFDSSPIIYYPNEQGEPNTKYREGSKRLAQILQDKIAAGFRRLSYLAGIPQLGEDPKRREIP